MQDYLPPIEDYRFLLTEVLGFDAAMAALGKAEIDVELAISVLEEAGKLCAERLFPLNRSGDEQGSRLVDGVVHTPEGFAEAYREFAQGGWTSLSADPVHGGQGLPFILQLWFDEMISAANLSFGLFPGLGRGATEAIAAHASEALKAAYLPPLVSGAWTGAMALTESGAGTDLALLRTRAAPNPDGSHAITGTKIFISSGEHDLTSNIIHLVLARLPDAPKGVKGISLFLVPKFIPDADGNPGARNGVRASGIEHKMGIKASATCQMQFDDAIGWLVGEPHRGLEAMFTMMNAERVGVGIQGLGIGEAAYQSAVWYAKDRLQGRSLSGAKYPDKAADPIIVHPDVRKNLLTMRAYNEGCRALGAWVARGLDAERHATDPEVRQRAEDFVALMTPVVKALFTDLGHDSASLAVQVYGGHGYIHESGVEQYQRDARIAMIYEGTNGIQALDLVGRKMGAHMGRLLRSFFHPVSAFIEENKGEGPMQKMIEGLEKAFGALQLSTATIAEKGLKDPEEAGAAATDYLRLLGLVGMAYCFAKSTKIAGLQIFFGAEDKAFYETKIKTATFFFEKILPQATTHFLTIKAGKGALMAFGEDEF